MPVIATQNLPNWNQRHARPRDLALSDLRFRSLLSRADWAGLPARARERFSKRVAGGDSVIYRGRVIETRLSVLGYCLGQILRLCGAPLPLEKSLGGSSAIVTVTEDISSNGQFWSRQYNRRGGFPQVIHSAKAFAGPTGLEECVGAGIGMSLRLEVRGPSLLFKSERYFATIFGRRFHLPRWMEPGKLVVGHHDGGNREFDFTLDLTHPLFGELVHQRARFEDMKGG
jgi:hypothetical protein